MRDLAKLDAARQTLMRGFDSHSHFKRNAGVLEQVDSVDLKSTEHKLVRVRLPPPAHQKGSPSHSTGRPVV